MNKTADKKNMDAPPSGRGGEANKHTAEGERVGLYFTYFSLSVPEGETEAFVDAIEGVCKDYAGGDYRLEWRTA